MKLCIYGMGGLGKEVFDIALRANKVNSYWDEIFFIVDDLDSQKETYELPIPMMNILNGGSHADNSIDFQEFMVMPVGASSFSHALQMGTEIFHCLKSELKNNGYSTNVGDEGGFAPNLSSNTEAIEVVLKSIKSAGYIAGKDVYIAIDAAASEFYNKKENVYHLHQSTGEKLSPNEMVDYWQNWTNQYPIISIEDGLDEDDWDAWKKLTDKVGDKIQLVGDDLFVTNVNRLQKGIDEAKKFTTVFEELALKQTIKKERKILNFDKKKR